MSDLTGQRFGRLLVQERDTTKPSGRGNHTYWLCRCDCGTIVTVQRVHLTTGNTRSCGCLRKEVTRRRSTSHGGCSTPEYQVWQNMLRRCYEPSCSGYANYGGRGIHVCARWRDSFALFLADVGPRPGPTYTIERLDNAGAYEPSNVVWATREEQDSNKSTNHLLTHAGKTQSLAHWAREYGINYHVLKMRIRRGWTTERALIPPVRKEKHRDTKAE